MVLSHVLGEWQEVGPGVKPQWSRKLKMLLWGPLFWATGLFSLQILLAAGFTAPTWLLFFIVCGKEKKKTLSKHFNYLLLLLSKNSFITAKGNMTETGGLEHENRIWALAPSSVLFRKLQVRKRLIFTWLYCRLKKVTCSKHTNIKSRVLTRHVFSYFWANVELIFWLTLQHNVDIRQSNL